MSVITLLSPKTALIQRFSFHGYPRITSHSSALSTKVLFYFYEGLPLCVWNSPVDEEET
jgi:hypothetical protein